MSPRQRPTRRSKRAGVYESGSTKTTRARRSRDDMERIAQAMIETLREDHPATCRGLFYRLVSQGIIEKTEAAYKGTVVRLATRLRLEHRLPFGWIADNTRWRHGGTAYAGLSDWFKESVRAYRVDIWQNQPEYVEIWLEKDALSGVLIDETDPLHVPLMVCRGYPSITYLANAAAHLRTIGKPAYLYYLGDFDPSGLDIPRVVEKRLREFAPDAEIHFERVAVTEDQIDTFGLPTRPTKATDSRAKGFGRESVEVDAIPAGSLRQLVRERIVQHIDQGLLDRLEAEETAGRETLAEIERRLGLGGVS